MRRFAYLTIILLLAGCAAPPEQSLNLAPSLTRVQQQQIESDAVKKLVALYPPAKTRLSLQVSGQDAFGTLLASALREQGYALEEKSQDPSKATSGLPVRYILDRAGDLYRITLSIGADSLSRPYLLQNGVLAPAGCWVHKEHGHE
jgi:type IV secretion system protein TrbH